MSFESTDPGLQLTPTGFIASVQGQPREYRVEDVRSIRVHREGANGPVQKIRMRVSDTDAPPFELSHDQPGIDSKVLMEMLAKIAQSLVKTIRARLSDGGSFGTEDWSLTPRGLCDKVTHDVVPYRYIGGVAWEANRVIIEAMRNPLRYDTTEDNNWLLIPVLDSLKKNPIVRPQASDSSPTDHTASATPTSTIERTPVNHQAAPNPFPPADAVEPVAAPTESFGASSAAGPAAGPAAAAEGWSFTAEVVSSPAYGWKPKQAKCYLSPSGLRVTLADKVVNLPIGCLSQSGKRQVSFSLPDRTLHVKPNGLFYKAQSLADDVGAFVTNGGSLPKAGDYDFEWYFIVLIALPSLIMLTTLEPGKIFGGFCQSGLCFWLVRSESWSKVLRLVLGGMVVALSLLGASGLVDDYKRQQDRETLNLLHKKMGHDPMSRGFLDVLEKKWQQTESSK